MFRSLRQSSRILRGPCIVFVALGVYSIGRPLRVFAEQQKNKLPLTLPSTTLRLKGLEPNATLTKYQVLGLIWKYTKGDWLLLSSVVVVSISAALVNIATPLIIGKIITAIQSASVGVASFNLLTIKLFCSLLASAALTYIDTTLVSHLGENVVYRIRRDLMHSLLNKDICFFDERMNGEITSRLVKDVSDFKSTFKSIITQGLKSVALIVGTGIQLFSLSFSLSMTLLGSAPIVYVCLVSYGSYLRVLSKNVKEIEANTASISSECLSNIRTVRAFSAEDRELERYQESLLLSSVASRQLGSHVGAFQGLMGLSIGTMIMSILFIGGKQVLEGDITSGELLTFMVASQSASRALASIGALFGQVVKANASAASMLQYIDHVSPQITGLHLHNLKGTIEFIDVGFAYPTRPDKPILNKFSIVLEEGKTTALVGKSGSGKSTISQLIERFYDPTNGIILLDNIPLDQIDPIWLRENIGYIDQNPVLFSTSILENIRFGKPDASFLEVKQAAIQANAHNFIQNLPDGYDTAVGERGLLLSGGERQRVSIARALLKDPKVLVLDEATSALDKRLVQDALDTLMKGRTTLVIAHRLSTIQNADQIVVIGDVFTNVLEQGSHRELMKLGGVYYRMYSQPTTCT